MTEPLIESGSEIPSACIFDVQSFSIHDGPGTRTTIFFKGCPLDCLWCHNPESKNRNPQIMFFSSICSGCMACVKACKNGAQVILSSGIHGMLHDKCMLCGKCQEVCCYGALKLCGRFYTPLMLLEKIQSDIPYIKEHGGITFSGGEPLLHSIFIKDFCALLPDIRAAVETSGCAGRKALENVINCVDLFIFDIKTADNAEHIKYCGAENNVILSNLEYLYNNKKEIMLRLPVIPGINDTSQHFEAVSCLIKKYPEIKNVKIMPYNNYGLAKMEALGMKIPEALPLINPEKEIKDKWQKEFLKNGLDIKVIFS